MSDSSLVRLPPFFFAHVLDTNTNLTSVIEGPCNYVKKDHQLIVAGPMPKIQIPAGSFCIIQNPAILQEDGTPVLNSFPMPRLRHSEREIRTYQTHPNAFVLYPGEVMDKPITKLVVVNDDHAVKLKALVDFTDKEGVARRAGTMWILKGPLEYIPRTEEQFIELIEPVLILPNTALKLRALTDLTDQTGVSRRAGQTWLVRVLGHYMRGAYEEVLELVNAVIITETKAVRFRATEEFVDVYGITRRPGDEWLVTKTLADAHIPEVQETVVSDVPVTVLTSRQYCFITNPIEEGVPSFGKRSRIIGPAQFFLQPNEKLEDGVQNIFVLGDKEALLLTALVDFTHSEQGKIVAGTRWLVSGPCEYIPEVWEKVVELRKAIPLTENEGIYVRNLTSGEVRAVVGQTYMLKCDEVLWEMELDPLSEKLVQREVTGDDFQVFVALKKEIVREKHRVVSISVPHNSATRIFDYKTKTSRVVFGPERVMLNPDEKFTVLHFSGGIPKREDDYQSLSLRLGPDFMRDKIMVETLDHARLSLRLSYRWVFDLREKNQEEGNKLFAVRDFIGNACKMIASRIRGAVSGKSFEEFHMRSSEIIRQAVFKRRGDVSKTELRFPETNLLITSVDVLSVKPVDKVTKECLRKSITMAIEITTDQYKMKAEQQAEIQKQQAEGVLELQKVSDQVEAEKALTKLYELQASSLTVMKTGQLVSDATASSQGRKIHSQTALEIALLEVQAEQIQDENSLSLQAAEYHDEEELQKELNELEVSKASKLAEIEGEKFKNMIEAIGRQTLVSVAKAGPELQAKLLKGLGLKGFMVTSGKNPINLFQTANGLLGQPSV